MASLRKSPLWYSLRRRISSSSCWMRSCWVRMISEQASTRGDFLLQESQAESMAWPRSTDCHAILPDIFEKLRVLVVSPVITNTSVVSCHNLPGTKAIRRAHFRLGHRAPGRGGRQAREGFWLLEPAFLGLERNRPRWERRRPRSRQWTPATQTSRIILSSSLTANSWPLLEP